LSYALIFRNQFYFLIYGLKITGHGNTDNNLESPTTSKIGKPPVAIGLKIGVQIPVATGIFVFIATFRTAQWPTQHHIQ
jgi:hypothetical protein